MIYIWIRRLYKTELYSFLYRKLVMKSLQEELFFLVQGSKSLKTHDIAA